MPECTQVSGERSQRILAAVEETGATGLNVAPVEDQQKSGQRDLVPTMRAGRTLWAAHLWAQPMIN
jgi:hypothetical protein